MSQLFDSKCLSVTEANVNMLVPWYLMAAWAYYQQDSPILSDAAFDGLCKRLDAEWDAVSHVHKHIIERQALAAGSCMLAAEAYPSIVSHACTHLSSTGAVHKPAPTRAATAPKTTEPGRPLDLLDLMMA